MGFYQDIIKDIKEKDPDSRQLNLLKNKYAKKYSLKKVPTNADILLNASAEDYHELSLMTKPTRTLSGVAPIAMMTRPHRCPHGTCIYCPGGPGSVFGDVPQSYTGKEPSTMRSMRNFYDPYLIVFNRLEQYVVLNQNPQKTEVIIQGGTFPAMDKEYKESYVEDIYKAMNDFSEQFYNDDVIDIERFKEFFELPGDITDSKRTKRVQEKILKLKHASNLKTEQVRNETAKVRCVGLTIETKPDWGLLEHANEMLRFGCTRVELGIQATDEEILRYTNRGHGIKESIDSTRILKDLGFKINYHMMPGLPKSNPEKDFKMLMETLENPDFRPDMYKIYPTMVLKGTALYNLYKHGRYEPLSRDKAEEIILRFQKHIPRWIRIMRVQRDIPTYVTEAGVDKTNLRQYVKKRAEKKDVHCQCIRCREAGLRSRNKDISVKRPKLFVEKYKASKGREFFISYEDEEGTVLLGYARLRFPSRAWRDEFTEQSAILRELHVVGTAAGFGEEGEVQHRGLGKRLLKKAEDIAQKHDKDKMIVISGVGVREYYRKFGYEREGPYMVKGLSFP